VSLFVSSYFIGKGRSLNFVLISFVWMEKKNDGSELLKEKVEGFSLFGRDGMEDDVAYYRITKFCY
jgi:hypothetical protein